MATYANEIGKEINFAITGLNISTGAGTLNIAVESPQGKRIATWNPTITNGDSGYASYNTTSATDLPGGGTYRFQGAWNPANTNTVLYTGIGSLTVLDRIT